MKRISLSGSDDLDKSGCSEEIAYNWTTDRTKLKMTAKKMQERQCFSRNMENTKQFESCSVDRVHSSRCLTEITDDDFSEVDIGPDGQRLYKQHPNQSQHFPGLGRQANSVHTGYRRQYDARSLRSQSSAAPMSVCSTRSIDPYDPHALMQSVREALDLNILPLQEVIKLSQEYLLLPSRKRRRRDRSRGSEDMDGGTSDEDRHSTRSDFPIHRFKRARNTTLRPYPREESYQFQRDMPQRSFNSFRVHKSSMSVVSERPYIRRSDFSRTLMSSGTNSTRSVQNTKLDKQSHFTAGTLTSELQGVRQMALSQQPPLAAQRDLRNLTCTGITEEDLKSSDVTDKNLENDHIFLKPTSIPEAKKNNLTAHIPLPPKPNATVNRLSDVSEIPELNQNSSNESMRPSFIKRKLFTQTLDVAQEKDEHNDDSLPLNSSVPNIYSSVPRPKNKVSKLIPRPLLKKNIFDASHLGSQTDIRHLIEQLVPQEKMNATTGNLQRKPVRSSIHEGPSTNNKENLNSNPKLDYDSDIFGDHSGAPKVQNQNIEILQSEFEKDKDPKQVDIKAIDHIKHHNISDCKPALELKGKCNNKDQNVSESNDKQQNKLGRRLRNSITKRCDVVRTKLTQLFKECDSSKNDQDPDISFNNRPGKWRESLDCETPDSSSLLGVRRSVRKVSRPSKYFDFSMRNTPKGQQSKPAADKSRALSPTFTASDSEMAGSPCKTPAGRRQIPTNKGNAGHAGTTEPKQGGTRKNVNTTGKKKSASPTYKVHMQRISFGRKAVSPRPTCSPKPNLNVSMTTRSKLRQSGGKKSLSPIYNLKGTKQVSCNRNRTPKICGTSTHKSVSHSNNKDLNVSMTTRSRLQLSGDKTSLSPAYNVKKSKQSSQKPRKSCTTLPKSVNVPSSMAQNLRKPEAKEKNTKPTVDSWLNDSSENESEGKYSTKQPPTAVTTLKAPTSKQHRSAAAVQVVKERQIDGLKTKSAITRDNKSNHMFKEPVAVMKAPPTKQTMVNKKGLNNSIKDSRQQQKDASLARSMSIISNQSKANKSVLPAKLRSLLPSDWEDSSFEEDHQDIRGRVNKLNNGSRSGQKKNVTSPARSVKSVMSEMSVSTAERRGVIRNDNQYIKRETNNSHQRLGMSTVTIGIVPSFCRTMDRTRNTRFDDNASVASFHSFRSTSSFRNGSKKTLLHF